MENNNNENNYENNNENNNEKQYYQKSIILVIDKYKIIFRQYRTLYIIGNKSNYITQLQNIKINKNNSTIIFTFIDNGIDLYCLINSKVFDYRNQKNLIKWILFQILKGLETMHSLNIIHRDINPRHILISSKGEVKISGFGNSINDIESKFVEDKVVGHLSYIAPECLLKLNFNNKIDLWCVGVIMLELYYKKTNFFLNNEDNINENASIRLFKQLKKLAVFFKIPFNFTENEYNQGNLNSWLNTVKLDDKIFNKILEDIPELEEDGLELLKKLLCFNPKERCSAKEVLKGRYFESFQNFNKDEFKKNKSKANNEDLSIFLKNLEKEYPKANNLPQDKKNEFFQKELYKMCQFKAKKKTNY